MKCINFVICSYAGIYPSRHYDKNESFKSKYLQNFLLIMNSQLNPNSNITQITIMRPKVNPEHEIIPDYYNFENLDIPNIKDKIKVVDCENKGISYGQFMTVINNDINDLFDYYIFTEDDYVPFVPTFDQIMIDEYDNSTPNFLCLSVNYNSPNNPLPRYHYGSLFVLPDFSVGIISRESIKKIYQKYSYDEIMRLLCGGDCIQNSQLSFGYILYNSGVLVKDLSKKHLALFNCNSNSLKFALINLPYNDRYIQREYKGEKFSSPLFMPLDIFFIDERDNFNNLIKQYLIDLNFYETRWNQLRSINFA